jgi:predicted secreted hydrolase
MGWDWFSLHLDNGDKLMGFRMHSSPSNSATALSDIFTTGTYINSNGLKKTLSDEQLSIIPVENETIATRTGPRDVPTSWRIVLKNTASDLALDFNISPFKAN